MTVVMGMSKFERFFRLAAGLDVDKQDMKRYNDFVNDKVYGLLVRGAAAARANNRDVIEPQDLPITAGLQESIQEFEPIDEEIDLQPILEAIIERPPLDRHLGEETRAALPGIVGGISVALAHTFKAIDPKLKNPMTEHWERAFAIFDHLL